MYNITLIATIHIESGKCNSEELHKILEDINPEMIFDELPSYAFDMYYGDSFEMCYTNSILRNRLPPVVPLEVECIKKYKQNRQTKIFPVDIDVSQNLSKQDEMFMFHTFFKYEDYVKLDSENRALIAQEGFHYLNSDKFLDYLAKKEVLERSIMVSEIQKDRLLNIYKLFHTKQYDNRENGMLHNIYNYSKGNQYNQAVFLIGAEHKKSMMQKITEYDKLSEIKLNWTMYGNK